MKHTTVPGETGKTVQSSPPLSPHPSPRYQKPCFLTPLTRLHSELVHARTPLPPTAAAAAPATCLLAALLAALQPPSSAYSLPSGGRVRTPSREPPAPAPTASREPTAAAAAVVAPDNVQLDAVRKVFERPRMEGIEAPPEALPGWLAYW